MRDLSLKIIINAVIDNARAGLAQTQGYIKSLAEQAALLTGKIGAVATQFILFANIAASALGQASMAVVGLIGNIASLGMQLFRVTQNYLGLSVSIDTHNKKLQAAQFLLNNFHKEVRLSLGFLGSFADYLNKINFPLQKLTAFIDGLSKAEIILGIGKGKERNFFDHLPEAIDAAKNGIKRFQDAFKNAKDDIQRDLKRFSAAAMAETVVEWRGVKFESSFADVKKVVSGSVESIKGLRKELLDLAANIAMPTEGLAKMQAIAGQLGFPVNEVSDFVKLVSKGSVAFELLPEQAAESFGNLKNIYGLTLKELGYLGDQINFIADKANTNEARLLDVMNRAGGAAQRFGLLRGETIALAAAMLSMGKPPEVVGTALDNLLSSLQNAQNQSKDFKEGLQLLGLDAKTLADNIEKNPKKTLDDFLVSLSKLSAKSQTDILSRLVGSAGESKGVIGDLISKIGEYNRLTELSKSADISGSMDATFKERQKTVSAAIIMMKNAFDGLAVSVSTMFLPTIRGATEVLRDLAVWLRKVNDEYPNLASFARIALIFGTLGTVMSLAFRALPGIAAGAGAAVAAAFRTSFVSGIKSIATMLTPMVAGLWNTVIGQFVIKMLAGVLIVQVGMSNLLGVIGGLTSALVALVSNPATLFLSTLGVIAARIALARGAFGALGVAAGGLGTVFMRLVGGPIGLAISAIAFLVVKYNEIKDESIQFGNTTTTLSEVVSAAWQVLMGRLSVISNVVIALFDSMGNAMSKLVGTSDTSADKVESRWRKFATGTHDLVNSVARLFIGLGSAIGVSLALLVETIETKFKHLSLIMEAAAKDFNAARNHFDFSGSNISAQVEANKAEDAAQKTAHKYAISDALTAPYSTDPVQQLMSATEAKVVENQTSPFKEPPPEEKRLSGGQDLPDMGAATTAAAAKKLAAANLDAQLSAIKTQQDALKNASDLELKQLENTFKAKELALKEQDLSETDLREKSLSLEKDKSAQELAIKRKLVQDTAALEDQASVEKIKAAQAAADALSKAASASGASGSLAGLVADGESGGDYNAYNRGTIKGTTLPSEKPLDLESMTIAEIQARQALPIANKDRIGAAGKYQVIADTLKAAVAELKLSADTKFDAATQEKIFTGYLVAAKRPALQNFITGKSADINAAQLDLAKEQAVVPNPNTGESYHKDKGGNAATMTTPQIQAALNASRDQYQKNINAGMGHQAAYTSALSASPSGGAATGAGGGTEEQQAANAKIKTLQNERVANKADEQAKLASIDQDAIAKGIELDTAKYEIDKQAEEKSKALEEENLTAKSQAALDGLSIREAAAQQELDMGNITQSEHLDKLRGFAKERLAIELQLLADKRKLLDKDALALAQNLHEKEALERAYQQTLQQLESDAEKNKREIFEGMVAPFKNAMSQMTNGVLTGQQAISNAVRNAANSVLVSYASTFLQERAMAAAQWAWKLANIKTNSVQEKAIKNGDMIWAGLLWAKEKTMLLGHWAWEKLGFGAKEAAKKGILSASSLWEDGLWVAKQAKLVGQWLWDLTGFGAKEAGKTTIKAAEDGASLALDEASKVAQIASNVALGMSYAGVAGAAGTASAAAIPVVGWMIAPEAGALDYGVAAGFATAASAKGGEWQVTEDGSPYILHEKESVLPAGVAANFRSVVDIVKGHVGLGKAEPGLSAPVAASIKQLVDSGQLRGGWSAPASVMNVAQKSQAAAVEVVKNSRVAEAQRNSSNASHTTHNTTNESPIVFKPVYNVNAIDTSNGVQFLTKHSQTLVKLLKDKVRKGAFGTGANK